LIAIGRREVRDRALAHDLSVSKLEQTSDPRRLVVARGPERAVISCSKVVTVAETSFQATHHDAAAELIHPELVAGPHVVFPIL
jgi:hypothetical protein